MKNHANHRFGLLLAVCVVYLCSQCHQSVAVELPFKKHHKTSHSTKETVSFTCATGDGGNNSTTVSFQWIQVDKGEKLTVPWWIEANNLTNVINKMAEVDGESSCTLSDTVQQLRIHLYNQTYFAFDFWANKTLDPGQGVTVARYWLRSVVLYEAYNNQTTNITAPDLRFQHPFGLPRQAFKCKELEFKGNGHSIVISGLHFWAFQNNTADPVPSYMVCEPVPGNSIVPVAVGGTLLVFMAISLGLYLWRRRAVSS